MANNNLVGIMVFGDLASPRNALTEEKYRKLSAHFAEKGFIVDTINYNDSLASQYETELLEYAAILVWVNPIEQGGNRNKLDALLKKLSEKGCFVSTHPDTILKIGTKEVLYKTRGTEFGGDIKLYQSFDQFKKEFLNGEAGTRILKQYRGNGGNGVFKIEVDETYTNIKVTPADTGESNTFSSAEDFFNSFETYFLSNDMLIDQPWNPNIINGMVRCYLSGAKVAGFGYQEINALYPGKKPSQRFYFSEDCGLFQDLKNIMENKWIDDILICTDLERNKLPVIWDADFFINDSHTTNTPEKYSLCEINVSCVSPFPESAIPYIVNEIISTLPSFA
jgi:hypothetical protein